MRAGLFIQAGQEPVQGQEERFGRGMKEQTPARSDGQSVAIATTDTYLFIVKGNYVYKFDIHTMKLLNKVALEEEQDTKQDRQAQIRKKIEQIKMRIEQLKKEGKVEEAERLENALKKHLEIMKKDGNPVGKKPWKKGKPEEER